VIAFAMPNFVLVQGAINGLSYGLLALGLVLIYRTNRVLNFSQGQLGIVGAVFMVKLYYDFGIEYWVALVAALAMAAAAGATCELVLRRLFKRPRVLVMVATIGLSQVLYLFTVLPFVRPKKLSLPFPVPIHLTFTLDGYIFTPGQVLTLIVAPLVAIGLALFIRFSPWGLAMRATAENADSARLSGVWVRRTSTITWVIAGLLSAFTAILNAPGQTSALTDVLSPDLLLLALTAALVGAMVNLPVAFAAGIAMGVIEEVLNYNLSNPATVELVLFVLLLVILLVRVGTLRKGARDEERSSWELGAVTRGAIADLRRRRVRQGGVALTLVVALLLPLVLDIGHVYLMSQVCIFAVIALSLTILTGWAGQVSLGQFGLVGVGAVVAARYGTSVPLVLLLPLGGIITAIVAVLVGLPALRVRGLYLAVSTLGFALLMQSTVLATSCWTVPLIHRQVCTGLPDPQSTLVSAPTFFGISLASERSFAWFTLGVLVLSVMMVMVWRDRGVARRLVSARDNEVAAGAGGIPIVRTKILAFALSGFMAGYAGVCLTFADQRISINTFDPAVSILVISMVVIGGLGSIPGAVLGALYLVGLPAIFGTTPTIQFITSGIGLLAFILYLPGGLAELLSRFGDLVAMGWQRVAEGPPADTDEEERPARPGPGRPGGSGQSDQPGDPGEQDELAEVIAEARGPTPAGTPS
jgi:ABC-type branched-subunit amino acid transport system permease subunit